MRDTGRYNSVWKYVPSFVLKGGRGEFRVRVCIITPSCI
jgi:hypothetical protein